MFRPAINQITENRTGWLFLETSFIYEMYALDFLVNKLVGLSLYFNLLTEAANG